MNRHEWHTIDIEQYRTLDAMRALFARESAAFTDLKRGTDDAGNFIGPAVTADHLLARRIGWSYMERAEWLGARNMVDVARIMAGADESATQRLLSARRQVEELALPKAVAIKPAWVTNRYVGSRVDVDRALQGRPDVWGRFERSRIAGQGSKIVSLYLPMGGAWTIRPDAVAWSPVPGLVIADLLEAAGYRVEIWAAATTSYRNDDTLSTRALFKSAETPVDTTSLARAGTAAFFRVLSIPVVSLLAKSLGMDVSEGRGHVRALNTHGFEDTNAVVLQHTYSLEAAIAEIKRAIAQFGDQP